MLDHVPFAVQSVQADLAVSFLRTRRARNGRRSFGGRFELLIRPDPQTPTGLEAFLLDSLLYCSASRLCALLDASHAAASADALS